MSLPSKRASVLDSAGKLEYPSELPKYTLDYNPRTNRWELANEKTGMMIASYETKAGATRRGILKAAVGPAGGSVKIRTLDGSAQHERTYPRNRLKGDVRPLGGP